MGERDRDRRSSPSRDRERDRDSHKDRHDSRSSRKDRDERSSKHSSSSSRHSSSHRSSRGEGSHRRRDDRDRDRDRYQDRDRDRERDRDRDRDYKRKRRSPSPVREDRPSKKRSSAWDQAPVGLDGLSPAEIRARFTQQPAFSAPPGGFAPGYPIDRMGGGGHFPAGPGFGVGMGVGALASTPQTQARRLYVGNVPQQASEAELKEFFAEKFVVAGFANPGTNFIHSVQINYERGFGFLELDNPDLATKGLSLDGVSFRDHTLKVRRPRDYQGPDHSPVPGAIRGIVSTNVPDSPNKIFIGGLPSALTEDQVKELVGTFGELKAFHLVKENQTNASKGYAFFEYIDPSVTDKACHALNNKVIGDKTLLVQRAHLGAKNSQAAYDLGMAQSTLGCLLNLHIPVTSTLQSNNLLVSVQPTPVLVLLNMISLQDLIVPAEVAFLEREVWQECSRFGTIKSVVIPSAQDEESLENVKGLGKVMIHFDSVESASFAQNALVLRKYNSRCLLTSYLDEDLFLKGCYDGPEDSDTDQAMMKVQEHYKNEMAALSKGDYHTPGH